MKKSLDTFLEIYEKHLSTLMFIGGAFLDNIAMKRVDLWWNDLILVAYLLIAAISIVFINLQEEKETESGFLKSAHPWFLFAMQFVLGGLFSSFFVFYSRSATLSESWPFLLVLISYMLANEFLKKRYARMNAQVSAFFVALFSFFILIAPVVVHAIGDWVFIVSGIISFGIISIFIHFPFVIVPKRAKQSKKALSWSVFGIFFIINTLYFTNIMPPAPLALKESGVYSFVEKNTDGTYTLRGPQKTWRDFFQPQLFKTSYGESVYVFSSIFSPAKLNTNILHVWQYYDENSKKWVDKSKINLGIVGGRDGGYRTYSIKENVFPGLWRVDIETERGQLIGREEFRIE